MFLLPEWKYRNRQGCERARISRSLIYLRLGKHRRDLSPGQQTQVPLRASTRVWASPLLFRKRGDAVPAVHPCLRGGMLLLLPLPLYTRRYAEPRRLLLCEETYACAHPQSANAKKLLYLCCAFVQAAYSINAPTSTFEWWGTAEGIQKRERGKSFAEAAWTDRHWQRKRKFASQIIKSKIAEWT